MIMSAQQLHWTPVDEGLYSESTTVIAVVQIEGVEQYSNQMEVAVFCCNECRGTAMAAEFPATHRYLTIINVYGETSHVLYFKAYDHATNQELEMNPVVSVIFTENGSGTLFEPLEISFTDQVSGNIEFADSNVKAVCVTYWDVNCDGELSYAEAAAVTNLNYHFANNTNIVSFDELQYFTGLTVLNGFVHVGNFPNPNHPGPSIHQIGNGVYYYGDFIGCVNLTSIIIPSNVSTIRTCAFRSCESMATITVKATTLPTTVSSAFEGVDKSIPLYVPYGTVEAYQNATGWSDFYNIIEMDAIQTNQFAEGWNWWSIFIEQDAIELLTALENELGSNGLYIKSQNAAVQNYYPTVGYNYWYGPLSSIGIQAEKAYMIKVSNDCSVEISGTPTDPVNHHITLDPNWNWIGYPLAESQTVTDALINCTPTDGDVIKSQTAASTYYQGYGWFPEMTLEPGQGYYYKSMASVSTSLTFANSSKDKNPNKSNGRYWKWDCHAYPENMTIIATLLSNNEELRDGDVELGAFVDGECRGSVKLEYFKPLDKYFAVMTVSGEEGEQIDFAFYDKRIGMSHYDCLNHIVFKANAVVGTLDEAYLIHFQPKGELCNSLRLYPNPVSRNTPVSIDIPSHETVIGAIITDVLGATIYYKTENHNIINGIATPGLYYVQLITKSGQKYIGKLIVK